MVLTHKVKKLKNTTDKQVKKTRFEKFKDFVKKKSFLIAVPFALTFYPMSVNAQETKVNYEHEDMEKQVEVNINKKMKKAHSEYMNGKLNERDYEIKIFKEVYSQLKGNEEFPKVKLSVIVEKMKEELDVLETPELKPVKKVRKKSKKPLVEVQPQPKTEEKSESVLLYEEIGTFEYKHNKEFEKMNSAIVKIIKFHNNKKEEILVIKDYNLKLHNNEIDINAALEFLFEHLSFMEEKTKSHFEKLKTKIDSCELCSDKGGLNFLLDDMLYEYKIKRKAYEDLVNNNINKKEESTKSTEDKKVKVANKEKTEVKKQDKEEEIINELEEYYSEILKSENKIKKKQKSKVIVSFENQYDKIKTSVPSVNDQGLKQANITNDLNLNLVTRSGLGFNFVAGFSAEQISFINQVHRSSAFNDATYYSADNYLGKFMGGFSYNTKDFSISLLGGYKVGTLKTDDAMGRTNRYPIVSLNLDLTENQFTRLRSEIPLLFNEGEIMRISFEHFSKYLVVNSNVNYSRQSSIENKDNGIIKNIYPIVNTNNMIGVGVYPFKTGSLTFNPTLLLVGNYMGMNADDLQKINAWSIGPGLGLNGMYKDKCILSLGYGLGFGKYNMKHTDFEGVNSFNYNSLYTTHNVFLMGNLPFSDDFNLGTKVNFSRGDAKGKEILAPFKDDLSVLLFLTMKF